MRDEGCREHFERRVVVPSWSVVLMETSPEDVFYVILSRPHLVHLTTLLPSKEVRLEKKKKKNTNKAKTLASKYIQMTEKERGRIWICLHF